MAPAGHRLGAASLRRSEIRLSRASDAEACTDDLGHRFGLPRDAVCSGSAHAEDGHTYTFQELSLPNGGGHAWIYLPDRTAGDRLPVVLIGPAGSTLVDGMTLSDGDRAEHIPYARAGFAVISFDIPGMATTDDEFVQAARQFKDGEGGVRNARAALALALDRFPRLDPNNVFVAGHSSAATLALTLCARMERLRGCVAYAPDVDLIKSRGDIANMLEPYIPGERAFLASISPIELVIRYEAPS